MKNYRIKRIAMFVFFGAVAIIVFPLATMMLWNALAVKLFALPVINFWQAAGLMILGRLIFGGFGGKGGGMRHHGQHKHWRERWKNMTEQEREQYKKQWQHCGYGYYNETATNEPETAKS